MVKSDIMKCIMPNVSIIVPAYNEEKYIAKSLLSLKKQTYLNYEMIVVNNNSVDRTEEIAKKYVKNVFFEKKKGYHHAVNRGVKEAKGEIITFCDADSIYPRNWLRKAINVFNKNKNAIAIYGLGVYSDGNFIIKYVGGSLFVIGCALSTLTGIDVTAGYNFFIKKEYYLKIGGYDPSRYNSIGMDLELGIRLKEVGKVVFSPSLITYISTRRIKKEGFFNTIRTHLGAWFNFYTNRPQSLSYEEYNQEIR